MTIGVFQVCLYMERVHRLYRQTENLSLGRIKKEKLSEISITGNKITQETDNQSKKAKVGSTIDETKTNVELIPSPNTNKQDYAGGTNDKTRDSKTCESEDSWIDTDSCARNIDWAGHLL